ncbi:MAG TPA: AcvB/VirJ family lysyl-phosphatidylglycerol hydrolase [Thermoanaerobaculia bacterium]|nr:AcvB/VirJ family lysyl-phosphatidylglycerol hydrolase [Thermoanaerobaculia bacterium]
MLALLLAATVTTSKLPLVEVPATSGASDTLVVFVSGDGGWAKIDKAISKILADHGMPVVGLNALQYFWTKRTPDSASRDLQTILERYLRLWKKQRVLFVGYSRGADVLPFMISRLPPDLRDRTRLLALLGPSPKVEFEFHIGDWMRTSSKTGYDVKPEVDKLMSHNIVCLFGEDDKDSLCPMLSAARISSVMLKGAHHFDGGYDKLAHIILANLQ